MAHHILTLCIGFLTFALATPSTAADQGATPDPIQITASQKNTQKIEIGNQSGNMKVGNIVQNQSGKNSNQHISIGSAKGKEGSANVVVGNIVQNQKGGKNGSQTIEVGKGSGAQVGGIIQNGNGDSKVVVGSP